AVGAHPDDLEILCGGTLARYVQSSHEVVMCNASLGDRGSFEHTSEEIARIRLSEARRAAALAGAEHMTLGLSDGEINAADREQIRAVVDLVRVEFVDVSDTIETKVAMLEAHESQLSWLRAHDGIDVVEQMRVVARFRGQQCGVAYAEAFAPCQTWLRGTTRRLLP